MLNLLAANDIIPEIKGNIPGFLTDIFGPISIIDLILRIIEFTYTLAGLITVVFIVYGGYEYLTSAGSEEKAKQGRNAITNAVIGIVIVLASVIIHNTIETAIGRQEITPPQNNTTVDQGISENTNNGFPVNGNDQGVPE